MATEAALISREDALNQIKSMINRTALLHYAYCQTLLDELGEEKGRALAKKAIHLYGEWVGRKIKEKTLAKGLPLLPENFQDDLPALGWEDRERVEVEGEKRARVYTCHLAKVWQELGAAELGRIYCFVDQAKYAAYNPDFVCVHTKNVLDGDSYCELAVRKKKK